MIAFAAAALTPNLRSMVAWTLAVFILWAGATVVLFNLIDTYEIKDLPREARVTRPGHLVFTYFALPHRNRELSAYQKRHDTEQFELFQVLYRYTVVGPVFESNDPDAELKSVSCRDVDVVIQH
jgi:hypothetical protein